MINFMFVNITLSKPTPFLADEDVIRTSREGDRRLQEIEVPVGN